MWVGKLIGDDAVVDFQGKEKTPPDASVLLDVPTLENITFLPKISDTCLERWIFQYDVANECRVANFPIGLWNTWIDEC
jgi:hypothetical protein